MTFRLADYRKRLMSFPSRGDETEKVIRGERWRREPDDKRRQRDREASNVRMDHLYDRGQNGNRSQKGETISCELSHFDLVAE